MFTFFSVHLFCFLMESHSGESVQEIICSSRTNNLSNIFVHYGFPYFLSAFLIAGWKGGFCLCQLWLLIAFFYILNKMASSFMTFPKFIWEQFDVVAHCSLDLLLPWQPIFDTQVFRKMEYSCFKWRKITFLRELHWLWSLCLVDLIWWFSVLEGKSWSPRWYMM